MQAGNGMLRPALMSVCTLVGPIHVFCVALATKARLVSAGLGPRLPVSASTLVFLLRYESHKINCKLCLHAVPHFSSGPSVKRGR